MQRLQQTGYDTLEIRSGGGCQSLFGVPFFLAGLFVTMVGLGIVPMQNGNEVPDPAWLVILLMGLVFVAVGGGLVFGRTWVTINRTRGTVSRQWGLIVPLKHTETLLHEYGAILLRLDTGDSDTADRYPVLLQSVGGTKDLPLCSTQSYAESRAHAEQLAEFTGLPVRDTSAGNELVSRPGDPLPLFKDRQANASAGQPLRPAVMKSTIHTSGQEMRIEIPGQTHRGFRLLRALAPLVILGILLSELVPFFRDSNTPEVIVWMFLAVAVLVVLAPLLRFLVSLGGRNVPGTSITVTSGGIRIEERTPWRKNIRDIPSDTILDLVFTPKDRVIERAEHSMAERQMHRPHAPSMPGSSQGTFASWARRLIALVPSKGITVKTRTGIETFGSGLPDDELEYLFGLISHLLRGEPGEQLRPGPDIPGPHDGGEWGFRGV